MQIAYKARDIVEAHIVCGMLQAAGCDAHVGGHYLQGAVGDMAPLDFAVVWVNDAHAELAQHCVAEYDAGALSDTAEHSPAPGGLNPQTN